MWLAQIYIGDMNFNQSLIDRGFAVPYMVGKFAAPAGDGGVAESEAYREFSKAATRLESDELRDLVAGGHAGEKRGSP